MDIKKNNIQSWLNTPKGEKISFWALVGLSVLIIIIAFFSFKSNLKSPFISWRKKLAERAGNEEGVLPSSEEEDIAVLQKRDTDKDGLSDFEELYVYKTSPYLADTDSDGINDKQEIDQGKDPNCPEGKACGPETGPVKPIEPVTNEFSQVGQENLSASQLRTLLEQSGVSRQLLDQADDQTLLEIYKETLEATGGVGPNSLGTGTPTTGITNQDIPSYLQGLGPDITPEKVLEYFRNMKADDLRKLMIEQGANEEELNAIDDATLKKIFMDALEKEMK